MPLRAGSSKVELAHRPRTYAPEKACGGSSLQGTPRIMKPPTNEVNARWSESRKVFLVCLAVLLSCGWLAGCSSPESEAEEMYAEARRAIDEERLDEAVAFYEKIIEDYPGTPAAERAREEIAIYRALKDADELYPVRVASDQVVRIARALDRYRWRKGRYPDRLDRLVPDYLDSLPVDPWQRGLVYESKKSGKGYILACYGADGAPGGQGVDKDLVAEDGKFVRGRVE